MKSGILYVDSVENVSQPQQPQVSDKVLIVTRFGTRTRERVGEIKEVKKNVGGKMIYLLVPVGKGTEAVWDTRFEQSLGMSKPKQEIFLRMLPRTDVLNQRLRIDMEIPPVLREKSPAEEPKGKLPDLDADGNGLIDKSEIVKWINTAQTHILDVDGLAFGDVARRIPSGWQDEGNNIYLLGITRDELDPRQQQVANQMVNKDVLLRRNQDGQISYSKKIKN
jgi:hypothetical protein